MSGGDGREASKAAQGTGGRGNHDSTSRFLLASLLWHEDGCGEQIGCRAHKPGRRRGDKYRCRGRRHGNCSMPPIDAAALDAAVREHFASRWVLDTQESVRRARDELVAPPRRSGEALIVAQQRSYALQRASDARRKAAEARGALDWGVIDLDQWGRLDRDYQTQLREAESAAARLTARQAQLESAPSVEDIDRVLIWNGLSRRRFCLVDGMVCGQRAGRAGARDRAGGWRSGVLWWWRSGSLGDGTTRRDGVDRLTATLLFAGWDRTSAMRRTLPLTRFATAWPWHRAPGDRSWGGGVPARRGHCTFPADLEPANQSQG